MSQPPVYYQRLSTLTKQMVAAIEAALAIWPMATMAQPFDLGWAIAQITSLLHVDVRLNASLPGMPDESVTGHRANSTIVAQTLVWTFHFLTQQPAFQQRVRQEVDHMLGRRNPTVDDLAHLTDTAMFLHEAFHYALPFWRLTGESDSAVPRALQLAALQLVIHQRPALWDHTGYCPASHERATRPDLALLEGQLILAMILQRYELAPLSDLIAECSPESLWVMLARRA